ncbi:hypothetical protein GQ457_02G024660 [Hibiscus cannabinus]
MFDLAINTTLGHKTLIVAHPRSHSRFVPTLPKERACAISSSFGKSFRDFRSLVYSGGLSTDLYVKSMEIKDSSASCHQEIKLLISLVKIQDWRFHQLIQEQGFSIPMFVDWFEKLYGSRSS